MKHISFPSIERFSNIVTNINRENNFVGLDINGDAIYDPSKPKPVLKFTGSVKLHGTNAGVCYNKKDGLWAQSRESIITVGKDNAGFAFFVESNKDIWIELIKSLATSHDINLNENTISIFCEWCGGNIQKGVGISNLEKSAFIFSHAKVSPLNDSDSYWIPTVIKKYGIDNFEKKVLFFCKDEMEMRKMKNLSSVENRIYNIEDFQTFEIDIDFNVPQLVQNQLIDWTLQVENECPVAKAFGFDNTIGEGIVFSYTTPDGKRYSFKSKGEKHSAKSKVHTLKPVDNEKINKCIEVANKVTPEWRLDQMLEKQFDFMNGGTMDIKKMGEYLKLVMADVLKEEMDVLTDAGIEPKDIGKYVSEIARKYFFSRQNQESGLI